MIDFQFLLTCRECGYRLTLEELDMLIEEFGTDADCPECGSNDLDV